MQQRPNILFIIDDQHRYDWLGCAGADWVKTPNLDALAARGMRMTHCFTNSPVCAPARVSLASGLLPSRLGAMSNETAVLPISTPNMYCHFRDNGYRVSLIGRHDLAKGNAPASIYGNRPLNFSYGFTEAFEVEGAMALSGREEPNGPYGSYLKKQDLWQTYCEDYRKRKNKGWILGVSHDSALPKEHHQDVFVARKAIERIEKIEDDYPWFMFISFQGPHDPFDPPAEYGNMYREAEMPTPIFTEMKDKPRSLEVRYNPGTRDEWLTARRQYAAKISLIDEQVGLIISALECKGLRENTIIVFCSDHGEMLGDHGLWIKHCAYEPSWRVPCIIAGPGISQGVSDALIELSDLNPTLTELAGLDPQLHLDAKSFVLVLQKQAKEHRDCVVCMEHSLIQKQGRFQAIRTRKEKMIITDNDMIEIYDMTEDMEEKNNVNEQSAEIRQQLTQMLKERLTEHYWMR